MLWIHNGNYTFQIVGYNVHTEESGTQSLWVTKTTGKTQKVFEGEHVKEVKAMLDYAIEHGEKSVAI